MLGLINGSLTSAVNVAGGATLAGIGSVGATTVFGTLAAGTSTTFGTLTVNGALTFNAGSTLATQVTATGADLVNVKGSASLNGSVLATTNIASSYSLIGTIRNDSHDERHCIQQVYRRDPRRRPLECCGSDARL